MHIEKTTLSHFAKTVAIPLNPEDDVLQLPSMKRFNDCTPDMVKEKDNQRKNMAVVSQFFCSPEPSAFMHATPESYSQAFNKKVEVFKDSSASRKDDAKFKAVPANKLTFSASWNDSSNLGIANSTPSCTKQLLTQVTTLIQNSCSQDTSHVLSPKTEFTASNLNIQSSCFRATQPTNIPFSSNNIFG